MSLQFCGLELEPEGVVKGGGRTRGGQGEAKGGRYIPTSLCKSEMLDHHLCVYLADTL